jgi:tetratricopeptide (TPR) repeat protein
VLLLRVLLFATVLFAARPAQSATVLVLRFHNNSQYSDLNWVGESISGTLEQEYGQAGQIALDKDARGAGMQRLSLKPDADFTKATMIHLGQSLDAEYLVFGNYDVKLAPGSSELKDSSIQITAHFIDLKKLHNGPDISEAGKLADLSRFKEHLAWESLKYIDPKSAPPLDQFMTPRKLTRLNAEESYTRGLLSTDKDQRQKWFLLAANLDSGFIAPAYELGRFYLDRKDYRQSIRWFDRVPAADQRYPDARFYMGLSAYGAADFASAAAYFREVVKLMPLNEVYNNLGAAEDQLNQSAALDDFRRALDGDPNDPVYLFNLGAALLRSNSFDEAVKRLDAASDSAPADKEVQDLLTRAQDRVISPPGAKPLAPARLKLKLDTVAFRQLKAMLQPKKGE